MILPFATMLQEMTLHVDYFAHIGYSPNSGVPRWKGTWRLSWEEIPPQVSSVEAVLTSVRSPARYVSACPFPSSLAWWVVTLVPLRQSDKGKTAAPVVLVCCHLGG